MTSVTDFSRAGRVKMSLRNYTLPRSDSVIYAESVPTCVIVPSAQRNWGHSRSHPCQAFVLRQVLPSMPSYRSPAGWFPHLVVFLFLSCALRASASPASEGWIPIRWTGGPLEVVWRTRAKTLPADPAVRDALARWYEPATLDLLEDSSVNCLLLTWSAFADAAVEGEQQQLVKVYAEAAHKRGLAVLGLVYSPGDAAKIAAAAARAALDGLVLDGEFAPEFPAALRKAAGSLLVVEIARAAAPWRWNPAPIVALEGVAPSARNLSEMGIRGAPSSEPWIESNICLVRTFGLVWSSHPVWTQGSRRHSDHGLSARQDQGPYLERSRRARGKVSS